jgi:hypothetical protein
MGKFALAPNTLLRNGFLKTLFKDTIILPIIEKNEKGSL